MFGKGMWGLISGVVVGAIVVGVLLATGTRAHEKPKFSPLSIPSAQAADNFVADWRRMKQGTWAFDSTFVRSRASDGQSLRSDVYQAQKPPKTVRIAFGTTTIDEPGKETVCTKSVDKARGTCRSAPTSTTFQDAVDNEMANVRSLVSTAGLYAVSQTDLHCYRLQSAQALDTSTWGQMASFCFDPATGALARSEIHKGDLTDTTTAGTIFAMVRDTDFQPPSDLPSDD